MSGFSHDDSCWRRPQSFLVRFPKCHQGSFQPITTIVTMLHFSNIYQIRVTSEYIIEASIEHIPEASIEWSQIMWFMSVVICHQVFNIKMTNIRWRIIVYLKVKTLQLIPNPTDFEPSLHVWIQTWMAATEKIVWILLSCTPEFVVLND